MIPTEVYLVLAWLLLPLFPASIGSNKGRSGLGFYLFGLLLFLPALVVALIISPAKPISGVGPGSIIEVETAAGSSRKYQVLRIAHIGAVRSALVAEPDGAERWVALTEATVAADDPADGPMKTCPDCAEDVRSAARICRYCAHTFTLQ